MEPSIITTSDLLRLSRPLTGAASLDPHLPASPTPPTPHHPSPPSEPYRTLKPLNRPALLLGTVSLPPRGPVTCGARNPCLTFSDGSSSPLCCSLLHMDPEVIGKKLQVLAWNFIPFKDRGGLLEVIRWIPVAHGAETGPIPAQRPRIRGLVGSVSPLFEVPQSPGSGARDGDSVGFLMELMECECGGCRTDKSGRSNGRHEFTRRVLVYFHGVGSSWHLVVTKLVGSLIAVSGLKKKLVFEGEESYLMRVSTEETVVRRWRCGGEVSCSGRGAARSRGELGCYDGVVTGVYMQGIVVELDERVWLVLADPLLAPPHSLRVGALISVRNVHIVCPNFPWTRELVLGACLKTTVDIKSFSPCDAKFPNVLRRQSLLGNFIASLSFPSRFWVLLLVACFRRKFVGVLTDKEILGSKNKEGLVQSYARLYLPCTSQQENGVFFDFCKHNDFGCSRNYPENGTLKLMAPMSSFLDNCKTVLTTILSQGPERIDSPGPNNQDWDDSFCEGSYHARIQRRFVSGDLLGIILVGSLRISRTSGRLQLVDATGGIDVVVPDLLTDNDERSIYEMEAGSIDDSVLYGQDVHRFTNVWDGDVKNYNVVLEWVPAQGEPLASLMSRPLSCRSIFQHSQIGVLHGLTIYVHFYLRKATCLDVLFRPSLDNRIKQPESNAVFHLLALAHKFPSYDDVANGSEVSDQSSRFAEAFLLPYHLILLEDHRNIHQESSDGIKKGKDGISEDSSDNGGSGSLRRQSFVTCETTSSDLKNANEDSKKGPYKIPCLLTCTGCKLNGFLFIGYSFPVNTTISESTVSKQITRKVLLEFKPDAFNKYESLYVGGFYMLECSEEELLCHEMQKSEYLDHCKVFIHDRKALWSFSLIIDKNPSQNDSLQNWLHGSHLDGKGDSPLKLFASTDMILHEKLIGWEQNYDVQLHLPAGAIELLKAAIGPELIDGLVTPLQTLSEICTVSSCMKFVQAVSMHSSGVATPERTMISLCGNVMDVHFIHNSSDSHFNSENLVGICSSRSHDICIHVHEDNQMVKIRGIYGKFICPIGFGPGVNATFHRLLITRNSRRWNQLTLISTSLIVINSIVEVFCKGRDVSCLWQTSLDLQKRHPFERVPLELIGSCHLLENNIIRFRCRVSGVLYLKLEKQTTRFKRICSWKYGLTRAVKIPIAAFLLDDGSSLCCCWVDADKAETLLRFQENLMCTSIKRRISKMPGTRRSLDSVVFCLEEILKKHHCITATNYGAVADSSCADITLFVNSNKVLGKLEEKLLKFIIISASGGPSFNIIGSKMGLNDLGQLKEGLIDIHMTKDLPIQHIWALEVEAVNPLIDARSLLHELVDS